MSTIDTSEFKTLLESERARLLEASGRLEADTSVSMDDATGEIMGGVGNHLADVGAEMYDRELEQGLDEGVQQTLHEIDAALQRIEDGTYGACEICGKPIGEERLRAIPWTTRGIDHAE